MGRKIYVPITDKAWTDYYNYQAIQSGHGLGGFQGIPYQRGGGLGSFFSSLFRSILPVVKNVGKSALKAVGKEALHAGANIIGDISKGQQVKDTLKTHGLKATQNLVNKAAKSINNQTGGRIGKRKTKSKVKPLPLKKRKVTRKRKDIFDG